jgi:hypothetical protein
MSAALSLPDNLSGIRPLSEDLFTALSTSEEKTGDLTLPKDPPGVPRLSSDLPPAEVVLLPETALPPLLLPSVEANRTADHETSIVAADQDSRRVEAADVKSQEMTTAVPRGGEGTAGAGKKGDIDHKNGANLLTHLLKAKEQTQIDPETGKSVLFSSGWAALSGMDWCTECTL